MGLGRGRFWIGGGGCLNSCQLSAGVRNQEFPPTEESGFTGPLPQGFAGLKGVGNRSFLIQKNRGYKPLPQEIHPLKNRGYKPLLQKITIPFPEEIHVDVGVSSFHPFLFLLLKQQKPGNLYASQRPFRCMLFNNFNIYCLKNV